MGNAAPICCSCSTDLGMVSSQHDFQVDDLFLMEEQQGLHKLSYKPLAHSIRMTAQYDLVAASAIEKFFRLNQVEIQTTVVQSLNPHKPNSKLLKASELLQVLLLFTRGKKNTKAEELFSLLSRGEDHVECRSLLNFFESCSVVLTEQLPKQLLISQIPDFNCQNKGKSLDFLLNQYPDTVEQLSEIRVSLKNGRQNFIRWVLQELFPEIRKMNDTHLHRFSNTEELPTEHTGYDTDNDSHDCTPRRGKSDFLPINFENINFDEREFYTRKISYDHFMAFWDQNPSLFLSAGVRAAIAKCSFCLF